MSLYGEYRAALPCLCSKRVSFMLDQDIGTRTFLMSKPSRGLSVCMDFWSNEKNSLSRACTRRCGFSQVSDEWPGEWAHERLTMVALRYDATGALVAARGREDEEEVA